MKKLSFKEIQNEEKEILKIVINYLDKYNIKYYIWAGSFLGAVRHKGFIPWDDDIDIIIPRPQYNKLIEVIKNNGLNINENIQFVGAEVGELDYPFLKVVNKKIIIKDYMHWDKNLWIDIFPLNGIPDNHFIFNRIRRLKKYIYNLYRYKYNDFPRNNKKLINKIKSIMFKFIKTENYHKYIQKYIDYCSKYNYNQSNYVCENAWGGNKIIVFDKQKMLEEEKYDFEDLKVNGFKNYDYILNKLYGEYMKLPPEEKRYSHNFEAWRIEEDEKII